MTKCANCGREFEGNGHVCFECADELEIITAPKVTGWTNADDEKLKDAFNIIGMVNPNDQWVAEMRLSSISRITIGWALDDIKQAQKRIKEIIDQSLDHFVDDNKMVYK